MDFRQVAESFQELEATSSRRQMVATLGNLLRAASDAEVELLAYLCQGRLAPVFVPLEFGMGEKLVAAALARGFDQSRAEVNRRFAAVGDLGLVAEALGEAAPPAPAPASQSVTEVYRRLRDIAEAAGSGAQEAKISGLAALAAGSDPLSAKFLVRIALGRLRLGVGDPTVLDALSHARRGTRALRPLLEQAYNRTSDLGLVARTLWRGGAAAVAEIEIQVGRPVRPALAERLPSAEAIIRKLGEVAIEPKYDGFRCQVHVEGEQVRIFSRRLEEMSGMFPEIVQGVRAQITATRAIFEGEAMGFHPGSGEYLPFQETMRRRRKYRVAEMATRLPLHLFAFDALLVGDEPLLRLPYWERRQRLEALVAPGDTLTVSPSTRVHAVETLCTLFDDAVERGLEGVMAKRPDSPYQAGGRNFNWVKLKRATAGNLHDTVDGVVLGYLFGRGKRAALGAGALLVGVYDDARDEFRTVTKIGTGLSDDEWREIRRRCDQIVVDHRPARVVSLITPTAWVEPSVVIEVLADEITRSPIHTCGRVRGSPGYALRFPRLVSFRSADRRPEDATTVREIIEMYQQQSTRAIA